jgi:aspartyl-tRNA(Asn)/glutamyl-tRNA(Gln) amidotransferase subunit A
LNSGTTPLWQRSAAQLVAGFREGESTPAEALQACLARALEVNPKLNALATVDAEGAGHAAAASTARWRSGRPLGPLDGVPITVKDSLHVRGLPTRCGSRALEGLLASVDETPVARLRDAGAVIFAKTNVPEFAMHGYTGNAVFGVTGNPWHPALTPGGSSGGAVAMVAAGAGPLALAQDGGGSIRRPASHTNVVGLKPSRHRVPRFGGMPKLYLDYEVLGPIARCVDDLLTVMHAIGRPPVHEPEARPTRILYIPRLADHPVDPQIAALTEAAAQSFAALGHDVETAQRFDIVEAVNEGWSLLPQVGLAWLLEHPHELWDRPLVEAALGPAMQANAEAGRRASARTLFGLLIEIEKLRSEIDRLFERYDFLLTPAAAALPWPAGQTHPPQIAGQDVGPRGHAVFTAFANAAGLPAIALPCGWATIDGPAPGTVPVGVQLVAREGNDDALFAPARAYERAHPWLRFPEL